jgi:membrane protein required for colicin V production
MRLSSVLTGLRGPRLRTPTDQRDCKDHRRMLGPLTYLDAALIGICALSGLLAMYRGLAREVLSILSWVVAVAAVGYFVFFHKPAAEQLAQQFNAPTIVAQVVTGAIIFLLVLIVVHLITARISDSILDSRIGMIDRIFGFGFGVLRGFLVVMILFMFYEEFFPDEKNQYAWVREAKSSPYLRSAGRPIKIALTNLVQRISSKSEQQGALPERLLWSTAYGDGQASGFALYRRPSG